MMIIAARLARAQPTLPKSSVIAAIRLVVLKRLRRRLGSHSLTGFAAVFLISFFPNRQLRRRQRLSSARKSSIQKASP
jgi:hypothetical protein